MGSSCSLRPTRWPKVNVTEKFCSAKWISSPKILHYYQSRNWRTGNLPKNVSEFCCKWIETHAWKCWGGTSHSTLFRSGCLNCVVANGLFDVIIKTLILYFRKWQERMWNWWFVGILKAYHFHWLEFFPGNATLLHWLDRSIRSSTFSLSS